MPTVGKALVGLALAAAAATTTFVWYLLPSDDAPRSADAVVVLGGYGPERAALGIEFAERFEAELVLSSTAADFGEQQGRTCGVDAICLQPEPETTRGEARGFANLAESEGWQQVTVITSTFHTSRSRFLFRQCLGDRVSVVGTLRAGEPRTTPRLLLREGAGVIAGATFQRAC